jgi:D-alanyl-D-alanine carboxypeptidase (penicillin-binding protein 5/6)
VGFALLGAGALFGAQALTRVASSGHASYEPPPAPEIVRCALRPLQLAPLPCESVLLLEPETGTVLYEQNADEKRAPASLVKMMLEIVIFDAIEQGELRMSDPVSTSANASTMGGSQVYLKEHEVQTVEALLDAVIIASANDASMALAEHVAGSEEAFVKRMNVRARELGCRATTFANVHGLDLPRQARNVTSARDLGTIAAALVKHPHALEVSSTWRKAFRGGEFWLDNTNKLLPSFEGLDGLKTGWTPRAGGCFVGTAERDGVRLIGVVLAAPSGRGRFRVTGQLLEAGFAAKPHWIDVAAPGQVVDLAESVQVTGDRSFQSATAWGRLRVLVEDGREGSWRLRPVPEEEVGRLREGDSLGSLDYRIDGNTLATLPARVPAAG